MSTTSAAFVGYGDIGEPVYPSDKKTISFTVHNFQKLTEKKRYTSSGVPCHGYNWELHMFPFGKSQEAQTNGYISVYLRCVDATDDFPVEANLLIKAAGISSQSLDHLFSGGSRGRGQFCKRSHALSNLSSHGALEFSVDIQVFKKKSKQWRPPTLQKNLIQLYDDGKMVDVSFALGEYVVRAHKFILSLRAPTLYEMVVDASHENSDNEVTMVELSADNIDADLFAMMIRFLYADTLPEYFELDKDGLDLLKMADRFGCSDLKMYLEAELIESNHVERANAAEILLLADSHSCALLKETAMDIVASNLPAITPTKGWNNLKQSADLLAEVCEYQSNRSVGANVATNNPQQETVSGMRKRLAELGQDVDGTKETLAKRLKSTE